MQVNKRTAQAIEDMERSRADQQRDERTKRQIVENQDAIEFWIATARHWHKRATFLEGVAQREKDTTTQAVTELTAQAMERDHFRSEAEQHRADCMRAEARADALGDVLDALRKGWRMESYDGCATWWRYDTDTLQALAKEAREWEQGQDAQPVNAECQPVATGDGAAPCDCQAYPILGYETPQETQSGYNRLAFATGLILQLPASHDGRNTWLMNYAEDKDPEVQADIRRKPAACVKGPVYMGKGEGEPFTLGDQQFIPECEPADGKAWTRWEWGYKPSDVAETDTVAIVTSDYITNTLEASVIDWEQVKSYRVIRANPIATASPVADAGAVMAEVGEAVAQADGFNGNMIGTDGDRVGFIWHATKYGFKSEYNPESATSAQIEDDYNRAFAYMQKNGHPLK